MLRTIDDIGSTKTEIRLSELAAGIYLIHTVINNEETQIRRIIKE